MKPSKAVISLALTCLTIGGIFWGVSGSCDAAIVFPKAPEGGQQIAYKHVAWTVQATPSFLGGSRIEELTITNPHQSYIAEPQDVTSGNLLSAAKPASWRYFIMRGTNTIGLIALKADKKAEKGLKFDCLQNSAAEMLVALQKAEQLPQVKKQDYEFRYLSLAPLSFFAVWLHGKSDDIILPLPPTYGIWNADQPYSESEIVKLLKPEVEKTRKAWESIHPK